jgi:serine phosphatase RsbU (regulator of sigma subunit)
VLEPVRQVLEPAAPVLEPARPVVEQPLPSPVEEVVQGSPVRPIREEVRGVVAGGGSPGGGTSRPAAPSGGGNSAGGNPGGGGTTQAPGTGTAVSPQGGIGSSARRNGGSAATQGASSTPGRSGGSRAGRDGTEPGGPGAGATGASNAGENGTEARPRPERTDEDEQGGLGGTVERIVEVIPAVIWVALAGLAILALALGARALVDNRRARALRREREALIRDMGLLERVLLPQVPERLGDLAVSVAYRPAEGPAAGGDFYDVFELSGGRVALLVGDVSGHGREALERTGSLRPTLHAHLEAGMSPRAALQWSGRAAGMDPDGGFTTVVVAVHDPSSGTLTYAAAGHPPPIVVGPAAHEPLTAVSAPPIGLGLRTGVRQTTMPLPRGSAACFFTDGLLEARSEGKLLGHEWLAGVVGRFGPLDSAAALLAGVGEHADATPDDMTACLVRAVAGPEAIRARVEELDLEPHELRSATPRRFLEACGVPAEAIAAALADAAAVAPRAGGAVLSVTIDEAGASATVTAPTPEALAST